MLFDDDCTWAVGAARRAPPPAKRAQAVRRLLRQILTSFLLVMFGFVGGCLSSWATAPSHEDYCPMPHAVALIETTQSMLHDVSAKAREDTSYLMREVRSARTLTAQYKSDLDVCFKQLKQRCPQQAKCAVLNPFRVELS